MAVGDDADTDQAIKEERGGARGHKGYGSE